ncbi:MAG: SulP family inorganic anion transporter [Pigmentiphaga sp.]|uniref:SulP family inorganic anion transporter n=1 Tax=Pigmentiphaga sp. TaxID=1977564 RepID=UPI0029AC6584|nr:SulP family inorganic anion transporter [Pigmentiphaga sp.]MDX3905990.1 SulP family inorganic anion transporter [Pigmentiphaga sp.]
MHASFRRYFPFLNWPRPTASELSADARAGFTLGLILVPQAVAYAMLAGMPPITGLYAALIPPVVSVLWGSCQLLGAGPVALTSMLVAGSLSGMAAAESARWVELAIWLALMAGAIQILIGAARLGMVVNFLPGSVVGAFTQAAALLIMLSQVPAMLGLDWSVAGAQLADGDVAALVAGVDWTAFAFGIGTLAFLFALKKHSKRLPIVLVAALAAGVISWAIGYGARGGAVVGTLPAGLPMLTLPRPLAWEDYRSLLPAAAVIALVSFVEALSSAKAISRSTRQRWNENQEFIGQGLAKVTSGLSGAFPVSASFSRSALNLFVGARTGWSALFAFLCVLISLLFLTPAIAHLPRAFLAAVIIVPVTNLISPAFFIRLWETSRPEAAIAAATAAATLIAAPQLQWGILAGFILSLGYFLYQRSHPRIVEVGVHEDGTLRDRQRFGLPRLAPDILAVRMDAALSFVTSNPLEHFIAERCRTDSTIKRVLLYAGPINSIDVTGVDTLMYLIGTLRDQGVELYLAGVKKQVEDVLDTAGITSLLPPDHVFRTEREAIDRLAPA